MVSGSSPWIVDTRHGQVQPSITVNLERVGCTKRRLLQGPRHGTVMLFIQARTFFRRTCRPTGLRPPLVIVSTIGFQRTTARIGKRWNQIQPSTLTIPERNWFGKPNSSALRPSRGGLIFSTLRRTRFKAIGPLRISTPVPRLVRFALNGLQMFPKAPV